MDESPHGDDGVFREHSFKVQSNQSLERRLIRTTSSKEGFMPSLWDLKKSSCSRTVTPKKQNESSKDHYSIVEQSLKDGTYGRTVKEFNWYDRPDNSLQVQ